MASQQQKPSLACVRPSVVSFPECYEQKERKCASQPFLHPVEHPPWFHCPPKCPNFRKPLVRREEYDYELTYDFQKDYMPVAKQDRVMPTMAFWFYCDHVPDPPNKPKGECQHQPAGPWPPLPQGVCPPPVECVPCGPGPWANPDARKFFYMDCQ